MYERGVQALQRHDFPAAAGLFRTVIERYPDERELLERARLYLRVCERETSRAPSTPKTADEWVYAATVALNSGDHAGALDHLQRALGEDPESDHAHYMMAVALGMRGRRRRGARSSPPRHRAEPGEPVARPPGSRSRGASAITRASAPRSTRPRPPNRRDGRPAPASLKVGRRAGRFTDRLHSWSMSDTHVVILAAGKGTRMKSAQPKVLHRAGGLPLIEHVLRAARRSRPATTVVVVGHQAER